MLRRLLASTHDLRRLETHVHVCVDDDDPALEDYQRVFAQQGADGDGLITGPRVSFAAWTNQIALKRAGSTGAWPRSAMTTCPARGGSTRPWWTRARRTARLSPTRGTGCARTSPRHPSSPRRSCRRWGGCINPAVSHYYGDNTLGRPRAEARGACGSCALSPLTTPTPAAVPGLRRRHLPVRVPASSPPTGPPTRHGAPDQMAADIATVAAVRLAALQPA